MSATELWAAAVKHYAGAAVNPNAITYICCVPRDREDQVIRGVRAVRPYVDRIVLLHNGNPTQNFKAETAHYACEVYESPWLDNLPDYLTTLLSYVTEGWVLRADPDEFFNETFLQHMRGIIAESGNGLIYNCAKLNCRDVWVQADGSKEEHETDYYRLVFFKWYPSVKYVGIGYGTLHETIIGAPWRPLKVPGECFYRHEKTQDDVYERSWRNFHIGGAGNTLGPSNPIWPEYRDLVKQINPELLAWQNTLKYVRAGNIDQRLKDFLIRYRNRNIIPDADTEARQMFTWYFERLHPEENVDKLTSVADKAPPEAEEYPYIEETYLQILGRHADQDGKKAYAEMIKNGKLRREELPVALMQSDEYKQLAARGRQ